MIESVKKRVLSGMRPTGRLHLGHYHGVLSNWLRLQEEFECFFFVADWHALTTDYEDPSGISENTLEMVIDWLSVGIDPKKSIIFRQSGIKQHAELYVLLSMLTPISWLERNPTYKDQLQELKNRDIRTHGFLGYPVLQTADIIIYKANMVPVGMDQAPHVELSREITRRFNHLYGEVFPEPETLLTKSAKVLGTDGRKMSKSYDNAIYISDSEDVLEKKMLTMVTDTARQRKTDPGSPDKCPFYETFHKLYSEADTLEWVKDGCTKALIGCVECKKKVVPIVLESLEPVRKKRQELESDKAGVLKTLKDDTERAREVAEETMVRVREVMGLS
jgi:tryptophanyl-tRNA synthetase